MTKTELQRMYEGACNKCKQPPDPAEFRGWFNVLGMFNIQEVQSALDAWYAGSRFMPTAKEILPGSISARNRHMAVAAATQVLVDWRCPVCHVGYFGFVSPDDASPRFCRGFAKREGNGSGGICGARLIEFMREAA